MKLLNREAAKLAFKFLIFHFKSLYLKKKKSVQRTDLSKARKEEMAWNLRLGVRQWPERDVDRGGAKTAPDFHPAIRGH